MIHDLYFESGPDFQETMVHEPTLPDRMLNGPTTFEPECEKIQAGRIPLDAGLNASIDLVAAKVTSGSRHILDRRVVDGEDVFTLNRAQRRTAEHAWEQLVELSRRPGGPGPGCADGQYHDG